MMHQKPIRLFEELSRHTGLSEREIMDNIKEKQNVLNWMVKHDVRDIQSVGLIMKLYYLGSEELVKQINKNVDPKIILKDKENKKW